MIAENENITVDLIEEKFKAIKPLLLDLKTAQLVDVDKATIDLYDDKKQSGSTDAIQLTTKQNTIGIPSIAAKSVIYNVMKNSEVDSFVFPIKGKGLWSTMYGFLCLNKNGSTIKGITFYEHGETPGLGGEIDNPLWKKLWQGREVYNTSGKVSIEVIKGNAGTVKEAPHQIDGLSGATITAKGVSDLVQFWMGKNAFEPYIKSVISNSNPEITDNLSGKNQ